LELLEPMRGRELQTVRWRNFGNAITDWQMMREGIVCYAIGAGEKMRRHKIGCRQSVRLHANNAFNNDPFYSNGASRRFPDTTNDTGEIVVGF
jgi:hypothetical protein